MSDSIKILYNPACSKCRLSMQLIEDKGVSPEVMEYLSTPPDAAELGDILAMLGLEPRQLMRKHEAPYKELNLADESLSRDELIKAMVENPILIERPVVIRGNKAIIGRPPENILELF